MKIIVADQLDPRLGRQCIHDPRSRAFALGATIDKTLWRTRTIRLYDPRPNPNQDHGNCTGCDKAMNLNAAGNRVAGRVLRMSDADKIYSLATRLDDFPGEYLPTDTGSSGLGACKAAQSLGLGGDYSWLFGLADEVVQTVVGGTTVGVGTWWYEGGFDPKPEPGGGVRIEMTGKRVGGHQWRIHGYDFQRDLVLGRCWWGSFRDFWIRRDHLEALLADDGDAHVQRTA